MSSRYSHFDTTTPPLAELPPTEIRGPGISKGDVIRCPSVVPLLKYLDSLIEKRDDLQREVALSYENLWELYAQLDLATNAQDRQNLQARIDLIWQLLEDTKRDLEAMKDLIAVTLATRQAYLKACVQGP